ncbi:MAG: 4-(cytidine 5'-diphospho)-2-C-methyl-D-erythritol kinase, partial [Lachnospiraceae bacterium]|nr:4-(cytidine 5'-diphospho)-2-C-methyl-D-erythritol kinase [Lachnospiraceae bacterium]
MKINAYAKINLGLDVTGKRDDGYHEVRMIMQNIDLHDELIIDRTEETGIVIT